MPDRSLRLPPLLLRERRPSPVPPREGGDTPDSGPAGERGSADGNGVSGGQGQDTPPAGSTPSGSGSSGSTSSGSSSSGSSSSGSGSSGSSSSGSGSSGSSSSGSASPGSTSSGSDDNPFAPPPEGTPDRPWQPRRPANGQGSEGSTGSEGSEGSGEHGESGGPAGPSPWGSQWSDRQPGPSSGRGFGDRPGTPQGQGQGQGQDSPDGPGSGPGTGTRWDPTDPAQRRARYALLSGMWAFFFALFNWPYVALLLGALALYWSISALRAKPRTPDPDSPASEQANARPQKSAAVSGLVTASLAIAMVAAGFAAQLVYSDYYACTNDALTNVAKQSCNDLLPKNLRGILGTQG
ncbi:hypothetical protein ACIPC1_30225 [Streptomyces sp. NPDC087263]|uniref:hypothetical protein n=1 Tax=Streptomyces sp. NPDC087263 TaxID=3365773 RepID=UPI0037FFC285